MRKSRWRLVGAREGGGSGSLALVLCPEAVADFGSRSEGHGGGLLAAFLCEGASAKTVGDFGDDAESKDDDHSNGPVGGALVAGEGSQAGKQEGRVGETPEPEESHTGY